MTRTSPLIASLIVLLATCVSPLAAQELSRGGRAAGRTGGASSAKGNIQRASGRAASSPSARSRVQPAGGQMMFDEGEVIQGPVMHGQTGQGPVVGEPIMGDHVVEHGLGQCDGNCDGGCSSCSNRGYCSTCNSPSRFCICLPSHGWVHAEYLLWWQSGMNLPPLVTTGGTTRATAGVLPTTVLFGGNNDVLDSSRSGGRIRFGTWFDRCPGMGLEGEYFGLGQQTESFFQRSTGTPVLARPFFNIVTGRQDAELVAFTGVLSGSVAVDVTSQLHGAAARLRRCLFSSSGCDFSPFCCTTVPTSKRMDATLGYRFYELEESLRIREDLTSTDTTNPGRFDIVDRFATRNQFNGGEVGVLWQGRRGLWSLDGLMRVGIGNTHQTVTITGQTATTDNGVTNNSPTGILASSSNIGTYERDRFTMIPELGLTLGYQVTRRVRLTTGYSLIYWGNVARPGDQVDLDVNPNLFPPPTNPVTGALRPQFQFVSSDYWVQGLSFGADLRW